MKMLTLMMTLMLSLTAFSADKGAKKEYTVLYSFYTGWEFWNYVEGSGILKQVSDKHGVKINLKRVNDYAESLNLYTGSQADSNIIGVTSTQLDILTTGAMGGVDSTALIVGDYSNGNDAIVAKNAKSIKDLKNREVMLVEMTVSDYMLARALEKNGMKQSDVKLKNTSDADMASTYKAVPAGKAAAVTWNPIVLDIAKTKDSKILFDSSMIPGEIVDLLVVKTATPEAVKHALVDMWYMALAKASSKTKDGDDAIAMMAKGAGGSVEDFKAQLKTTAMFYTPKEAVEFTKNPKLEQTMDYVRKFSHSKGLYNGRGVDYVGIQFDNGNVIGNKNNIKLRFTTKYMNAAPQNK